MAGYKITLDSIVKSYMIEKGEETTHNYMGYLTLAIKGMNDLDFDVSGMPTYKEMTVGDNSTLIIPDDSLNVFGVSFNMGGRMFPFAKTNTLNMSFDSECGTNTYADTPQDSSQVTSLNGYGDLPVEAYTNHYRNGEVLGGFYNDPTANVYLFRENAANGTIELSSNAPNKVVLEYLPASKRVNSQFMLSPFLEEPILAWLRWATVRSRRNVGKGLIDSYQRSYVLAKEHLDSRLTGMTAADFIEAVNYGRTAAPRL